MLVTSHRHVASTAGALKLDNHAGRGSKELRPRPSWRRVHESVIFDDKVLCENIPRQLAVGLGPSYSGGLVIQ